jgi:hypothetical protein
MAMTLAASVSVFADDNVAPGGDQPKERGLDHLLGLVSSPKFPSLSGLIQPEEMGVLTGNRDNLHDNKMQLGLLSDNQVKVLSDLQILSGISVHVTIRIDDGDRSDRKTGRADRPANREKSQKSKKHRRSKRDR